ncbi:MAG: DinB family protein [Holophagaceae bacterium]|nr:DinB family protein [Holophagaceae bacterium]
MFRHLADFKTIWAHEVEHTLHVLEAIPDAASHQAVAPEHRDLRRIAWHLVETCVEMPGNMGLKIEGFAGEPFKTHPPATMKEIRDTYAAVSGSVQAEVAKLNDMALAMDYPFYGMTWTGALGLFVLVTHQSHHRGQMTVLMRQAGLKVPGTYGPAKEEWGAFGMETPVV